MRFERIRIARFGPLREVDSGESPLPGLVAVHGPNEAGKSSFFLALRSLLHGIYPASREGNPYAPWDGQELEIHGELLTRGGERIEVHRRLLSTPWGRLHRHRPAGEEIEDLGNRSIPAAAHLPRSIFEHVYTITLPELAALRDGSAWQEVRDRLVVGMGARDLGSPARVARALEDGAKALWRPDRRGDPRAAQLRSEQKELSDALREARDRDRDLREVVRERADLERRLEALRARLVDLRGSQERARTYLPLEKRLAGLAELHARARPTAPLEALPPDPITRLDELRNELRRRSEELAEADIAITEARRNFPTEEPLADALESERERLRGILAGRTVAEDRAARIDDARNELEGIERELTTAAAELLTGEAARQLVEPGVRETEWADELSRVPIGALRQRIAERGERAARRAAAEDRLGEVPPDPPAPGSRPGSTIVAIVSGVALLLLAAILYALGLPPIAVWGVGVTGGAAVLFGALRLRDRQQARRDHESTLEARRRLRSSIEARIDDLRSSEDRARSEIHELLRGVPLRPERARDPDESVAAEIEGLSDRLERRDRLFRSLDRLRGEQEALHRDIGELRGRLGTPASELPADDLRFLTVLEAEFERVERRAQARREAETALERAREERARIERECREAQDRLDALSERLADAAPTLGDDEARAHEASRRLQALEDARRVEAELVEAHGPIPSIQQEIRALHQDPALDGRSPEALDTLIESLGEDAAEIRESLIRLEHREQELVAGERADRIEARLEELRREEREAEEERDRLWVLSRLVRVSEKEFREAHQPALIRRAEAHLARVTGGRYTGLLLGDEADADALLLQGPHLPGAVPVEAPISTGTREQVFLALRVAILGLLDGQGEPLPLILDEALVNWDQERRARGLDLLAELARERQVFMFTCHESMAREVEARGGRLIRLDEGGPGGG